LGAEGEKACGWRRKIKLIPSPAKPAATLRDSDQCGAGAHYKLQIDEGRYVSDPASRFSPEGPHRTLMRSRSILVQMDRCELGGVKLASQIIYEMHIGTFTPAGTWRCRSTKLSSSRKRNHVAGNDADCRFSGPLVGVTTVSTFSRQRGSMEHPMICGRLSIVAHSLELGVILDVVYNHFGPDGNYLGAYSDDYLRRDQENEWGDAINFDVRTADRRRVFHYQRALLD
jgi:maltooligosyltrehalose trehalohydrolase